MIEVPAEEWTEMFGGEFKEIHPSEPYHLESIPQNLKTCGFLGRRFLRRQFIKRQAFIANFRNVYINGGRVINESGDSQVQEFADRLCTPYKYNPQFIVDCSKTVSVGVHLVGNATDRNYWHWLSLGLARLYALDEIPKDARFFVNSLNQHFVAESLEAIGINPSNCIEMGGKTDVCFCMRLLAPSHLSLFDDQGLRFLKRRLGDEEGRKRRLYIVRQGRRIVTNEAKILPILMEYGFEAIQCENMSFQEQVQTFSSAEVVIAPHGSGLANLIFAPNGTKVLEFFSPKYKNKTFKVLCNHFGHPYYVLLGRTKDKKRRVLSDIEVDPSELLEAMQEMGLKKLEIC